MRLAVNYQEEDERLLKMVKKGATRRAICLELMRLKFVILWGLLTIYFAARSISWINDLRGTGDKLGTIMVMICCLINAVMIGVFLLLYHPIWLESCKARVEEE